MPTSGVSILHYAILLLHIKTAWSITPKRPEVHNHTRMVQHIRHKAYFVTFWPFSSEEQSSEDCDTPSQPI